MNKPKIAVGLLIGVPVLGWVVWEITVHFGEALLRIMERGFFP